VPPPERAVVTTGLEDASTSTFHFGIGIGALLVFAGGVVSLVCSVVVARSRPATQEIP
jgi:hypothetical protein